jgi:hypothetical protein
LGCAILLWDVSRQNQEKHNDFTELVRTVKNMKQVISKEQLQKYWDGHYEVKVVVPMDEDPYIEEYLFDQEELDRYLEHYAQHAAFIISVEFLG